MEELPLDEEGPFPAKILLSKKENDLVSVKVGTLDAGMSIATHAHDECNQIEYIMGGMATMYIEGLGEKELRKGTFTFIPKGVKHGVPVISEPLTIYTVFTPPLF
jgi:quercetin dioxygenase-like cupin family protein